MKRFLGMVIVTIILTSLGCSHPLTLTNRDEYFAPAVYVDQKVTVGISPATTPETERYIESIVENLRSSTGEIKVVYPYIKNDKNPVDYIIDYNTLVNYDGDGVNFFVSFPGFLIFAPWWNGYYYHMDIQTKMTITDCNKNTVAASNSVQTKYSCVHSQFDRTWTQGMDWLIGYGAFSLFGGIYFTTYDNDITPEFMRNVTQYYGPYLARKSAQTMKTLPQ